MSKDKFSDWDTTEGNNTDLGGLSTQGTQTVNNIDNLIRRLMAQLRAGVAAIVGTTTDNAVARFDGTSGQMQNSAFLVDDTGHVSSFGGNIKFPSTPVPSADANTLDDFKKGTTTPTLTAGSGTITSGSCALRYTKIGNRVFISVIVSIATAGTAAGGCIVPLPYTSAGIIFIAGANGSTGVAVNGIAAAGSSSMNVVTATGTSIFANAQTYWLSGHYDV